MFNRYAEQGLWITDGRGRVSHVDRKLEEISGISRESLMLGWPGGYADKRDIAHTTSAWHRSLKSRRPYAARYRILYPGGNICWLEDHASYSAPTDRWVGITISLSDHKCPWTLVQASSPVRREALCRVLRLLTSQPVSYLDGLAEAIGDRRPFGDPTEPAVAPLVPIRVAVGIEHSRFDPQRSLGRHRPPTAT